MSSARDNSILTDNVRKKNDLMFKKHLYACGTELNFRFHLKPRVTYGFDSCNLILACLKVRYSMQTGESILALAPVQEMDS